MLCDFEKIFVKELKGLPLVDISSSPFATAPPTPELASMLKRVPSRLQKEASQAYAAFLGFYNSNTSRIKIDKHELVDIANRYSANLGLETPPPVSSRLVSMCRLKGIPGIKVMKGY